MAIQNPLTGYEPNQLDNFDYSETSAAIFQEESVDIDTEPSFSCDAELDDELIGKALLSPPFNQEREEPANLGQTYHSHEESLLSSQSSSVGHVRTGRLVSDQFDSLIPNVRENPCRDSDNEQIRILLERQKSRISQIVEQRFRDISSKPIVTEEISKN